jgi:predicted transglutaminase-like cysteine proteinase
MCRRTATILCFVSFAWSFFSASADARNKLPQDTIPSSQIVEGSPTLAPFQHVRFCLRYPSDCKSDPAGEQRIEPTPETLELLERVNSSVNAAIVPTSKDYGTDLEDGWTISPSEGDCNDYAVTKRHELLRSGLPAKALRLSVVKTMSGIGHLVLVVATVKGDVVLDNLTQAIRPWQSTDYHWLKIQSANDARFWYEVKAFGTPLADANRKVRLADR